MSDRKWNLLANVKGDVRYPLTNDYLFRAVLQKNPKALEGLVCALLYLKAEEIKTIEIMNPIILGERMDAKTFVLDIRILLNSNTVLNIEMQVTDDRNWTERSMVYLCRAFDQAPKGGAYSNIRPAIHISILNFTLFKEYPEFYAKYQMLNMKNHHVYSDKFKLHILDLTQAENASQKDRETGLYHWAKFIKARTWEEIKMLAEKNNSILEAAVTMYDVSAEENIRLQCEARRRYEEDRSTLLASGRSQGREEATARYAALTKILLAEKNYAELEKAADDAQYREALFRKYQL